ncbi:hypothetical protein [Rhodobacter sp. CZR27]|uniref:hypothetical protein n=1 Tax=Rhodobacter sp. CZR27 TaxID=2033869 RepID=UPI0012FE3F1C|nr:hypothetical protein [Rhodobacter sp. CZR27]
MSKGSVRKLAVPPISMNEEPQEKEKAICGQCSAEFEKRRRNQKFCSDACRKNAHQKRDGKENPRNSLMSPSKRRENELFFDTNRRIAEDIYTRPPCERFDYVAGMIEAARSGHGKLRALLMNKLLLFPDYDMRGLFHRNCPAAYLTTSQIASVFCGLAWKAEQSVVTIYI